MLRVELVSGSRAEDVAGRLREHDSNGLLAVTVVDRPGVAALVIDTNSKSADERVADVVLDADAGLAEQVDRLWSQRLGPFAARLAGITPVKPEPAVLQAHDPGLLAAAQRLLDRLRTGLRRAGLDDGQWTYDHIGSTSVPELRAKRFIDLQLGVAPLPEEGSAMDEVLAAVGYSPARGARPDSPGVHRDGILDPDLAPAQAYRKRLFFRPDPPQPSILHVRQLGCPWWSYTVAFRDWLRADPAGRRAYERMKQQAAQAHAHDADYDDYTRAKASFFRQVQRHYE
jgi:dephospho-CoA kinase